jgi:hypothetical protein
MDGEKIFTTYFEDVDLQLNGASLWLVGDIALNFMQMIALANKKYKILTFQPWCKNIIPQLKKLSEDQRKEMKGLERFSRWENIP